MSWRLSRTRATLRFGGSVVLFASVAIFGAAQPAAADTAVRHITFNMCSGGADPDDPTCYPISTATPANNVPGREDVADRTYDSVFAWSATSAHLTEICQWQRDRMQYFFGLEGNLMTSAFRTDKAATPGCTGAGSGSAADFGNSTFVRGAVQRTEVYLSCNDVNPGAYCIRNPNISEQRRMVCMITRLPDANHEVRACTAHLIPRSSGSYDGVLKTTWNDRQLDDVSAILTAKAASGSAIILGGDLNAMPSELRALDDELRDTDAANTHTFTAGNPTKKIDYVLLSTVNGRFTSRTGTVTTPSTTCRNTIVTYCSDHRILKGTAVLEPQV